MIQELMLSGLKLGLLVSACVLTTMSRLQQTVNTMSSDDKQDRLCRSARMKHTLKQCSVWEEDVFMNACV